MRALFLLSLVACAVPPRDRLGDERVIDRLTPLLTTEDKQFYLPGERAHIVAIASDPEYRDDISVDVVSCPKLGAEERDFQCLGTASEIVLFTATPRREDEMLIFELDYDIPTDLPLSWDYNRVYQYFREHVYVRMKNADRYVLQMAELFISDGDFAMRFPGFTEPSPEEMAPIEAPPPSIYSESGERIVFSKDKLNTVIELSAGEYSFGGSGVTGDLPPGTMVFGGPTFFCTPGCYAPPPPDNTIDYGGFSTKIVFQAGTEPRLYFIDESFSRFIISVR